MKIQQIRNAMVRIRYAGKTFLTDPWLAPRGSMGTFRDYPMFRCRPERLDLPLPLCDLPMPVADILTGVDAYIVTHVHPDHIDMAADGSVGAPLDKAVPVFVQSEEDAAVASLHLKVGISDKSNFYKHFKAHTGMTPTEYKKSAQK